MHWCTIAICRKSVRQYCILFYWSVLSISYIVIYKLLPLSHELHNTHTIILVFIGPHYTIISCTPWKCNQFSISSDHGSRAEYNINVHGRHRRAAKVNLILLYYSSDRRSSKTKPVHLFIEYRLSQHTHTPTRLHLRVIVIWLNCGKPK